MQIFIYIALATIIIVTISSTILRRKNYPKYGIPTAFLIGVSFVIAVVSFFTLDGWESMGFFFMFICITIGSLIGTGISMFLN